MIVAMTVPVGVVVAVPVLVGMSMSPVGTVLVGMSVSVGVVVTVPVGMSMGVLLRL